MEGQSSDPGDLRWQMGHQEPLCFEHALCTLRQVLSRCETTFPNLDFFFFLNKLSFS